MNIRDFVLGVAFTLSAAAIVLALWAVVAEAPWVNRPRATEEPAITVPLSKKEQCLQLALAPNTHYYGIEFIEQEMDRLGCLE